VLVLSSIALPCTAGFAAEFPLLVGVFQRGWAPGGGWPLRAAAVLSLGGMILGAWYMLWMFQRVFLGAERSDSCAGEHGMDAQGVSTGESEAEVVRDLSFREMACLAPLIVAILWIGLQPQFFFDRMAPALNDLAKPAMGELENRK
jgi:NADH-quinone oxidoreductase subunit M